MDSVPIIIKSSFQEVNAKSKISIDWAYKFFGLVSASGNPNVNIFWQENEKSVFLDGGQTLIIKADGSYDVE